MKNAKRTTILTTLVCLLPLVAGALLYARLPERVPTHWGSDGTVNGWSSRAFAAFGLPAMMAGIHLLLVFALRSDPKRANMSGALLTVSFWICPVLSVLISAQIYGMALGHSFDVTRIVSALVGVVFLVIGNYLPKTHQSYTMGIRLPWTLASEENWDRTHRLAGFLWVLVGAAVLLLALLGAANGGVLLALLLAAVLIPTGYSYVLYRRGV